jgi:hypothetical protein
MEGARLHLMGPGLSGAEEVLTGADGRFEVRGLSEDTYELRVERPGYLSVTRELRLPRTEPLELSLEPAAAVAVKVLGARGEPVEEAVVSLSLVSTTHLLFTFVHSGDLPYSHAGVGIFQSQLPGRLGRRKAAELFEPAGLPKDTNNEALSSSYVGRVFKELRCHHFHVSFWGM